MYIYSHLKRTLFKSLKLFKNIFLSTGYPIVQKLYGFRIYRALIVSSLDLPVLLWVLFSLLLPVINCALFVLTDVSVCLPNARQKIFCVCLGCSENPQRLSFLFSVTFSNVFFHITFFFGTFNLSLIYDLRIVFVTFQSCVFLQTTC